MNYDPVLAQAILKRTPQVVRALLAGLPAEWLDAPEGPGAWSPRDIACHLADLERDAWLPRLRTILEHGRGQSLRGIERERFHIRFHHVPLEAVLDEFAAARAGNLLALSDLVLDDRTLVTPGLHPDFGAVELGQLLATWVVHDLTHLAQISRALASQYRDAVGPWIPVRASRQGFGEPRTGRHRVRTGHRVYRNPPAAPNAVATPGIPMARGVATRSGERRWLP